MSLPHLVLTGAMEDYISKLTDNHKHIPSLCSNAGSYHNYKEGYMNINTPALNIRSPTTSSNLSTTTSSSSSDEDDEFPVYQNGTLEIIIGAVIATVFIMLLICCVRRSASSSNAYRARDEETRHRHRYYRSSPYGCQSAGVRAKSDRKCKAETFKARVRSPYWPRRATDVEMGNMAEEEKVLVAVEVRRAGSNSDGVNVQLEVVKLPPAYPSPIHAPRSRARTPPPVYGRAHEDALA